jgi:hypothetical protein
MLSARIGYYGFRIFAVTILRGTQVIASRAPQRSTET